MLKCGDPKKDLEAEFLVAMPRGVWFAAEVTDKRSYSLVGASVGPGFEFEDWEIASKS